MHHETILDDVPTHVRKYSIFQNNPRYLDQQPPALSRKNSTTTTGQRKNTSENAKSRSNSNTTPDNTTPAGGDHPSNPVSRTPSSELPPSRRLSMLYHYPLYIFIVHLLLLFVFLFFFLPSFCSVICSTSGCISYNEAETHHYPRNSSSFPRSRQVLPPTGKLSTLFLSLSFLPISPPLFSAILNRQMKQQTLPTIPTIQITLITTIILELL